LTQGVTFLHDSVGSHVTTAQLRFEVLPHSAYRSGLTLKPMKTTLKKCQYNNDSEVK